MARRYQANNQLEFTDIILIIGIGINLISLRVNQNNNNQLEKINENLTKINDGGVLEKIANGGNENV